MNSYGPGIPLTNDEYVEKLRQLPNLRMPICGIPNRSYCEATFTLVRSQKTRFRECFAKLILEGLKRFQLGDVTDHSVQLLMYTKNFDAVQQLVNILLDDVCGAEVPDDELPLKSIDFRQIDYGDVHMMGYTTPACRNCVYDHCEINEDDAVKKSLMMRLCPFVHLCKATCGTEIMVEKLAGNIPPPVGYKPLK